MTHVDESYCFSPEYSVIFPIKPVLYRLNRFVKLSDLSHFMIGFYMDLIMCPKGMGLWVISYDS